MIKAANITVGILAHVDAGKTTLAETLLYQTGVIRTAGRVDHRDAHLDTYSLEKERGITIFSKQARFPLGDCTVTLLDTPGHVDFSAEMERTLQVLDYALLVISGADGVQGHVMTLWKLLRRYNVPVFIFVNKMDQPGTVKDALMRELKEQLDTNCMAFPDCHEVSSYDESFLEELATCDEELLDRYLEGDGIAQEDIVQLIRSRKVFPCYFGSALKMEGTKILLDGLLSYAAPSVYPDRFGARVFRIARDGGTRLTYMKVTGGVLKARQVLDEENHEKADQLRLYNGSGFEQTDTAPAGTVLAVTGLTRTRAGDTLGEVPGDPIHALLEPLITCSLILPEGTDVHTVYQKLRILEEEIPEMHLNMPEGGKHLQAQIMGEVQTQVLQALILERTGLDIRFADGQIVYRETIADVTEGVGHFEPLRHYAEVHLVMEPGSPGSGITFSSDCTADELDINWQRLIQTHVEERQHPGVLTGAPLTDVHITLTAGKAHLKHTQGGDFRQAVYRAIRQGLMKTDCILLEPYYSFRMELPVTALGRAMSDVQTMGGQAEPLLVQTDTAVLTGVAPVAAMRGYPLVLQGYTGARGRIFLTYSGYAPCHNSDEVIEAAAYDPEKDAANPPGSVFCMHGAGMYVPWNQVDDYMHLESTLEEFCQRYADDPEDTNGWGLPDGKGKNADGAGRRTPERKNSFGAVTDEELLQIFRNTYGANSRENRKTGKGSVRGGWKKTRLMDAPVGLHKPRPKEKKDPVLIVDGYNIIFGWDELKKLAADNLDGARVSLMDTLCNYQGFRQMMLIVVFDAYKVSGGRGEAFDYHNIHVVYTKEAQTADAYIERFVKEKASKFDVTVATSDYAQQLIVWGEGARRMSARELKDEVRSAREQIQDQIRGL